MEINSYFKEDIIGQYYPEAEKLMFPAMLCWKLPTNKEHMMSEICEKGEYFLQEKKDGAWYQFVKTANNSYLFGRTISKNTGILTEKHENVPHITEAFSILPANTVIIGEIYVPGGTSKNVTHIMGCLPEEAKKRQAQEGNIRYYCHDIIYYDDICLINVEAEIRYKILEAIWKLHKLDSYEFLDLAKKIDYNLEEEISKILKNGGEGAVLKKRDSIYTPDKRPAWSTIKIKQMDSTDVVVTRTIDATKEYTGKDITSWPYWELAFESGETIKSNVCQYGTNGWIPITKPYYLGWKTAIGIGGYNTSGELVEFGTVSSGLTDEDRASMAEHPEEYIGKVCAIDCMSLDKDEQTIRHPVFKMWRDDKNADDCTLDEIFKK